jgi:hypothetical protein
MTKNLIVALLFSCSPLWATTYYVDNSCTSNGNGSATSCAASSGGAGPFNSIANAQSGVTGSQPGNSVLLKAGETFRESYTVSAYGTGAGQFTISSYGIGAAPIISGANLIDSGWTNTSGNIWQVALPTSPGMVFFNGTLGLKVGSSAACTAAGDWYWA